MESGRPSAQNRGTRGARAGAARRTERSVPALPEVAALFSVLARWPEVLRAAMQRPEPDASADDAMDSFLEKFQSQPYRAGFHEDQWEEVGGPRPGVSARVWGRLPDSWELPARRRLSATPTSGTAGWRIQGFYMRPKNRPRGFEDPLRTASTCRSPGFGGRSGT